MNILLALIVIAFLVFLGWLCWKFLPWEWTKYLGAGIFGFAAGYKLVLLLNAMTGGTFN